MSETLDVPWRQSSTCREIKHLIDIAKNKMSPQNLQKYKTEPYQGACQETDSNIEEAAGISEKYRILSADDNKLLNFSQEGLYRS